MGLTTVQRYCTACNVASRETVVNGWLNSSQTTWKHTASWHLLLTVEAWKLTHVMITT